MSPISYSTPRTWVSGEYPTAAQFNANIRDNIAFLANPPACRVYHSAAQSIADITETTVAFNSERFDTDTMHDTVTNNSRITIKTAGLYIVSFTGNLAAVGDYAVAHVRLWMNGATYIAWTATINNVTGVAPQLSVATVYKFAVNDFIQVRVYQDNTANVARNLESSGAASPEFAAAWIGFG